MAFSKNKKPVSENIVVDSGDFAITESFNRLKDNILYYNDDGTKNVIQIESSVSGEGKSFVLANLSVVFAKSSKKVVLVDLDFRKPKVHREFQLLNDCGIADYLKYDIELQDLIKHTEYGVDVVTSGKNVSNPTIIFTSKKFEQLIKRLKEEYDYVLLDCPPILQISDYILISKFIDAAIFVVSCGKVKKSQVGEALTYMRRNDVKIIGTVMTFAENMNMAFSKNSYYKNYSNYITSPYNEENKQ